MSEMIQLPHYFSIVFYVLFEGILMLHARMHEIRRRVRAEAKTLAPPSQQLERRPAVAADEDPGLPNLADLTPPSYSEVKLC